MDKLNSLESEKASVSTPFESLVTNGNLTDVFYIPHIREIFTIPENAIAI